LSSEGSRVILDVVPRWSLSVLLAALSGQACVPTPPPRVFEPPPARDQPCTAQMLATFEPPGQVVDRGALPPLEQATETHTEQLIVVACEDGEEKEACLDRARRSATEAYPAGTVTEAAIGVDREIVRAEVSGGDGEEVIVADSLVELAEIIAERRSGGESLVVTQAERVPAPDAQRSAVLRVALPGRSKAREALRAYVVLAAPVNPVRTLLELQVRAAEAKIGIRVVEPRDDGTILVEIGCQHRVQTPQPPPGTEGQGEGATTPGS